MNNREGLTKLMTYRVAHRSKRDDARFEKFYDFEGPDDATMKMLTDNFAKWMANPASFWGWNIDTALPVGDPRAYIVESFMQSSHEGC